MIYNVPIEGNTYKYYQFSLEAFRIDKPLKSDYLQDVSLHKHLF